MRNKCTIYTYLEINKTIANLNYQATEHKTKKYMTNERSTNELKTVGTQ